MNAWTRVLVAFDLSGTSRSIGEPCPRDRTPPPISATGCHGRHSRRPLRGRAGRATLPPAHRPTSVYVRPNAKHRCIGQVLPSVRRLMTRQQTVRGQIRVELTCCRSFNDLRHESLTGARSQSLECFRLISHQSYITCIYSVSTLCFKLRSFLH